MIAYITLGTNDLEAAGHFYDAVLAPLGYCRLATRDHEIGYGTAPSPDEAVNIPLWIMRPFDGRAATAGNGVDVAFTATSRAAIDAFHAAALALGGKDEGAPGLRPAYGPHFYTAYLRDLDGNKLNAVFNQPTT
jgi:catechol 2,3-dioxygenase-like lactoylglutathione lyase family enzyme